MLILVQGTGRLIATNTAFALAHSLTLFAATLGWSNVPILQLRNELGWSRSRRAESLQTDQTTVSRWERGLIRARVSMRGELETLETQAGLLTLGQVAGFVKASPFRGICSIPCGHGHEVRTGMHRALRPSRARAVLSRRPACE